MPDPLTALIAFAAAGTISTLVGLAAIAFLQATEPDDDDGVIHSPE